MKTPLLLVATATRWLGTARMPRPLSNAGFDVSLLTPKDSLAEKSRFITKIGHLPDNATPRQWVHAFAAMVEATAPRLVMPCDDTSFRLLQMLAISPPEDLRPAAQLAALIRDSLGDPAWYRASVEKTLLPPAAEGLGVRVPRYTVTSEFGRARAFVATNGYPAVLKSNHSSAGSGVRICTNDAELAAAFATLQQINAAEFEGRNAHLLVQAHMRGCVKNYSMSTWKGAVLTGYAAEKLETNPPTMGPSTVTRYHHDADIRQMAVTLAAGFGMTGFLALECVVDERTGEPCLLEINRRLVPGGHRGSSFDVDHCSALYSALHGTAQRTRPALEQGEEHLSVHFPQEWLRDPSSEWLRKYPVDVPWDEPELIEAMLALRNVQ